MAMKVSAPRMELDVVAGAMASSSTDEASLRLTSTGGIYQACQVKPKEWQQPFDVLRRFKNRLLEMGQ